MLQTDEVQTSWSGIYSPDDLAPNPLLSLMPVVLSCQMFLGQAGFFLDSCLELCPTRLHYWMHPICLPDNYKSSSKSLLKLHILSGAFPTTSTGHSAPSPALPPRMGQPLAGIHHAGVLQELHLLHPWTPVSPSPPDPVALCTVSVAQQLQ